MRLDDAPSIARSRTWYARTVSASATRDRLHRALESMIALMHAGAVPRWSDAETRTVDPVDELEACLAAFRSVDELQAPPAAIEARLLAAAVERAHRVYADSEDEAAHERVSAAFADAFVHVSTQAGFFALLDATLRASWAPEGSAEVRWFDLPEALFHLELRPPMSLRAQLVALEKLVDEWRRGEREDGAHAAALRTLRASLEESPLRELADATGPRWLGFVALAATLECLENDLELGEHGEAKDVLPRLLAAIGALEPADPEPPRERPEMSDAWGEAWDHVARLHDPELLTALYPAFANDFARRGAYDRDFWSNWGGAFAAPDMRVPELRARHLIDNYRQEDDLYREGRGPGLLARFPESIALSRSAAAFEAGTRLASEALEVLADDALSSQGERAASATLRRYSEQLPALLDSGDAWPAEPLEAARQLQRALEEFNAGR